MFLKRNIKEDRKNLVFYTDGSLLDIEHNIAKRKKLFNHDKNM
ncbi:27062_t:CDS:2 [Gigaspora margarita]|uniref:27062_t:CDS:1 n=1 Tax=Gigaspora margarita TaxID=4874 RepID=A0ABN7UMD9_GIGMA|nr:27062_t:CDS:2 [Gigaspora margarita]